MESSSSDRVELPAAFEDVQIDHLAQLIGISLCKNTPSVMMSFLVSADMLERVMAHNDQIPLSPYVFLQRLRTSISCLICTLIRESLTRFHSRSAPSISILDYLKRIIKYTNVEVRIIALQKRCF